MSNRLAQKSYLSFLRPYLSLFLTSLLQLLWKLLVLFRVLIIQIIIINVGARLSRPYQLTIPLPP